MGKKTRSVHVSYSKEDLPHHKIIAELANKYCKKNGTIIDIGCGVGNILSNLKDSGHTLNGVDIDKNCLEATCIKVPEATLKLIENIETFIVEKEYYDVVIMSHVLEHLTNPYFIIENLFVNKLTANGVLILAVPNPVRPQVILRNIQRKDYVNRGHVYSWDFFHWKNFLERILKLEVIQYAHDYVEIPFFRRLKFIRPIEKKLTFIFPFFSFSNIAVIKKGDS